MSQQSPIYQTSQPTLAVMPVNLMAEYPQIPPDDIRDVLDALMVVRNSTGWGRIEIIFLANDIDVIHTQVTKKRTAKSK
jgi:hypothetical protein